MPGTSLELDPVQAAFCIGAMVRWLDFNDTWLAAEWGHPSDNLGGIPIGHRRRRAEGIPLLLAKFERNLRSRLAPVAVDRILAACADQGRLEAMPVHEFVALFAVGSGV